MIFGQIGAKIQNCISKKKSDTVSNSNMRNEMAMLTFSILEWNYPLSLNSVTKKSKLFVFVEIWHRV